MRKAGVGLIYVRPFELVELAGPHSRLLENPQGKAPFGERWRRSRPPRTRSVDRGWSLRGGVASHACPWPGLDRSQRSRAPGAASRRRSALSGGEVRQFPNRLLNVLPGDPERVASAENRH